MEFEADYFQDNDGKEYIKTYLNNLKNESRPLWEKVITYLREKIKDSQFHVMPYWKPLGKGIFEIRNKFRNLISRIYCCFSGEGKITLLCGGDKKSQQKDIKKAHLLKVILEERKKNEKNKSRRTN